MQVGLLGLGLIICLGRNGFGMEIAKSVGFWDGPRNMNWLIVIKALFSKDEHLLKLVDWIIKI